MSSPTNKAMPFLLIKSRHFRGCVNGQTCGLGSIMGIPQVANDENTCLFYDSCVSRAEVVAWERGSRGIHEGLSVRDDREESKDWRKLRELRSGRSGWENFGKTPMWGLHSYTYGSRPRIDSRLSTTNSPHLAKPPFHL